MKVVEGIAGKARVGSRKINQMRLEIKETVSLLVSMLERTRPRRPTEREFTTIKGPKGWEVRIHDYYRRCYTICRLREYSREFDGTVGYSSDRLDELPDSMVQGLHGELDALMTWVVKDFPGVSWELLVLLRAAQVEL